MNKRETRTIPATELRITPLAPDGTRTISGTAIVFGQRSQDLGNFVEIVAPGAVTNTLSSGQNVLLLNNHNSSQPIASTASRTLQLTTDSKGVSFTAKLDTRQSYANDLALSIESGVTSGCSFGFITLDDSYTDDAGTLVRTLNQIDLFELSVTVSPAYLQTVVDVRSRCPKELRSLLDNDEDDDDECDCPTDADGNVIGDCDCDDDDDDDEDRSKRSVLVSELERSRMQLKIELAKRK
jgi:HK97 family phage prohead protease